MARDYTAFVCFSEAQCRAIIDVARLPEFCDQPGAPYLVCRLGLSRSKVYKVIGVPYYVRTRPHVEVKLLLSLIEAVSESTTKKSTFAALRRKYEEILDSSLLPPLEKLARV